MSAGPVDPGKIPNCHEVIICDPDEKQFEKTNIGLLYTAPSRATRLGDIPSCLNSAIYFDGADFTVDRIRNLTKRADNGQDYEMAKKRKKWVQHLMASNKTTLDQTAQTRQNKDQIIQWAKQARISPNQLQSRINTFKATNKSISYE